MFGRELALGSASAGGRLYYRFFGHDHMGLRVRAMHVRRMLSKMAVPRAVLDAGSGDGCYSVYLACQFPKARVTGIELRGELVANCRTIASRLGLANLDFVQADLVTYRLIDTFDIICCIDVLEHTKDDRRVLRNLPGALRESGQLLLHVPQKGCLQRHHFREWANVTIDDHLSDGYDQGEIVAKLRAAGLATDELRHTFGWFGSLSSELSRKLENTGRWRAVLKPLLFPLLIGLAYLDTLTPNREHQGLLLRASKAK